ncbi:hypothetical protein [Streptomyces sp. SID3343]|uniref:hypothetical protein n=1 Tax=Streptomyces sp. SID3343 TaxID=2690260 RepID=UPI00137206AD|nr:hypothetical protein [Streptomyces sp. SID3343]MYW03227.1 hypothetical protein [Streptomyces sp. SID3343]
MTSRVGPAAALATVAGLACLLGGCDVRSASHEQAGPSPSPTGDTSGVGPLRPTPAPATSSRPPPSSCDLLSPARVREVLAVGPLSTRPGPTGRACGYLDGNDREVLTVTLGVLPQAMVGGPADAAEATATGSGPRETVTGLSDAAILYHDPVRGDGIAFARAHGDTVTSVDITAPALERQRLVALGRTAADTLG